MSYLRDTEHSGLVINAIDNAVVPDANPVQMFTRRMGSGLE